MQLSLHFHINNVYKLQKCITEQKILLHHEYCHSSKLISMIS